jgi:hypothetical protein
MAEVMFREILRSLTQQIKLGESNQKVLQNLCAQDVATGSQSFPCLNLNTIRR